MNSLQCRGVLDGRNLVRVRNYCSRHLWFCDSGRLGRVEIVTLTVGVRAKEGKGEGRKNTPAWYHCSFGKLCYYFYSPQSSTVIKSKMAATTITISTLVIRTRFARSTKTYTTFTSSQDIACSERFFFWRVDYALEGSLFWLSKCDFSCLFHTERSWHAYWFSLVFEFLVFMICPLMQEHFLWPLLKHKALFCC